MKRWVFRAGLKESELSDGSRRWAGRVPDDGACNGEGPATKLAPVMSCHIELMTAGRAKTLTTGDVGGRRATVGPDIVKPCTACTGEQSLRACTGPAQERPASATRCEVNMWGRGQTPSFGRQCGLRHLGRTAACLSRPSVNQPRQCCSRIRQKIPIDVKLVPLHNIGCWLSD